MPIVARKSTPPVSAAVAALARCLGSYDGRYRELTGAASFGEYVGGSRPAADEEQLTEPLLASILEDVLGFAKGDYFPQLGKSGLKPDFTPTDLITHPFVLDAKGSGESLSAHVAQIRRYVDQRALRYGVLFNLRQIRVYPRGVADYDRSLSFELLPLWRAARGEVLPVGPEFEAFNRFVEQFSHRVLSTAQKIEHIRHEPSWAQRLDTAEVDVEFLVEQLRRLASVCAADAQSRSSDLALYLGADTSREGRLLDELRQLALDFEPSSDVASLPDSVEGWRSGSGLVERVWRQYLVRVAYLALTMTVHEIAVGVPLRHSKIRASTVGRVRFAGYDIVSSPGPPGHADLVLPTPPTDHDWSTLDRVFDPPELNPATMRLDDD